MVTRTALSALHGLLLTADGPCRPRLRVEVTSGRRLLIRQNGEIVLFGQQRAQHRGVHYARTGLYRSALPHLGARQARRFGAEGESGPAERWAHWFAGQPLEPLHDGRWNLVPGLPHWAAAVNWERLTRVDPDRGHITWFGYGDPDDDRRDILPLRRLSPPDAGRVKAYRKLHREGVLPPALLWWVSGLNTLLVLDGHDRIVAALAEGATPPVLVLAPAAAPEWVDAYVHSLVRHERSRKSSVRLAEELARAVRVEARTRAWPVGAGDRKRIWPVGSYS